MEIGIRIGAACVMTAASAWGGKLFSLAQMRRTQTLRTVLTGVRRLNVEMLEHRLPMREALAACGGIYGAAAQHMTDGTAPEEAYLQASARLQERGGVLDSLTEADMTALRRLFSGLGAGGVQTQRLILSETAEELERLIEQAGRKQEQSGRLYTSLGALGGLAAALLML